MDADAMDNEAERLFLHGVADYLDAAAQAGGLVEEKEIVLSCLAQIFPQVDMSDLDARARAVVQRAGHSPPQVYAAGIASLEEQTEQDHVERSQAPELTTVNPSAYEEKFDMFVASLKRTKFFDGINPGTPEYDARVKKARAKFEQKFGPESAPGQADTTTSTRAVPAPAEGSSDSTYEDKTASQNLARAEEFKQQGNDAFKAQKHEEALSLYTKAIELDPSNAVYYSNRAAASINLERYSAAIDDAKHAVSIDPNFVRAYDRLARAYRSLDMVDEEIDALEHAVSLDPSNEKLRSELTNAESRRDRRNSLPRGADPMAGMAGGMPAGMPDLSGMMNNPMFAQMASQFMSNPEMQRMMQDPDVLRQAMGMFGGAGGGSPFGAAPAQTSSRSAPEQVSATPENAADPSEETEDIYDDPNGPGVPPDLSSLLGGLNPDLQNMVRNNPDLARMADEVRRDPSAISRILSDPAAMSNIMSMAGSVYSADSRNSENDDSGQENPRTYYS
ncbi:Small glutamine-rich tetratricopeptide repeat-containing protein 2 [Porphyridium purpureum]|uniref:Small glutamine-rich tetratricopeptide repeat-containing protein 2 n=1 Tax=Porphyridium purpureum TaxID=35688 RepID=A0A5J4Z3G0_PORPP|nr:Small glutamine-rich tetratricopeptide repeat-containing protein 2 [Porphyridium purpureum]|eukprot:POR6574..scf295_1